MVTNDPDQVVHLPVPSIFQACLRHPGCASARENRDTVFCQMRRAMDLIHYVVRDGLPGHDDHAQEIRHPPDRVRSAEMKIQKAGDTLAQNRGRQCSLVPGAIFNMITLISIRVRFHPGALFARFPPTFRPPPLSPQPSRRPAAASTLAWDAVVTSEAIGPWIAIEISASATTDHNMTYEAQNRQLQKPKCPSDVTGDGVTRRAAGPVAARRTRLGASRVKSSIALGKDKSPAVYHPRPGRFRRAEAAQWEAGTALGALRGLGAQVRAARARGGADAARRRAMASTLRALVERTHDFTDSAYTSHEHRQRILLLAERIAYELERLVAVAVSAVEAARFEFEFDMRMNDPVCARLFVLTSTLILYGNQGLMMELEGGHRNSEESGGSVGCAPLESASAGATSAVAELERALVAAARDQARDLAPLADDARRLASELAHIANSCGERESERLHSIACRLHEQLDHIIESCDSQVCKLLRHIATSETLQVSAKFAEINLRIYGPQVVTAARALAAHPGSAAARENLDVFVDMWAWLLADAARLARDLLHLTDDRPDRERERDRDPDRDRDREHEHDRADKHQYSSLPRPGKHGTTSKPLKAVRLDSDEQAKIAKSGLEMKMMSSEMDAETEKWQVDENNDIVKRAKNMSSMAFAMYQFTKGEGRLNTTQDLFTQAEYFAEEANRLYKIVRQFSYQVPAGTIKKELLEHLDKVPTYVQQLQFTVKEPTVGRAATFNKVDNVIQETKNLMNVISKVVTTCFDCANKYKLDFTGLSAAGGGGGGGSAARARDEDSAGGGGGDAKPGGSTSDTGM
ncbi:Alpha-catulin [Eumeta japonica]|uniref:Alpha-catulin n=1 Tax=Eumeta variegata TaxID=151549 RepID=A0A4C1U6J9_EUMVA|nr:Alpha-catulin [Eumeta japonica]